MVSHEGPLDPNWYFLKTGIRSGNVLFSFSTNYTIVKIALLFFLFVSEMKPIPSDGIFHLDSKSGLQIALSGPVFQVQRLNVPNKCVSENFQMGTPFPFLPPPLYWKIWCKNVLLDDSYKGFQVDPKNGLEKYIICWHSRKISAFPDAKQNAVRNTQKDLSLSFRDF